MLKGHIFMTKLDPISMLFEGMENISLLKKTLKYQTMAIKLMNLKEKP